VLGHITTFGGHPLSCAAGLAAFRVLIKKDMPSRVTKKEALFRSLLNHPRIKQVRSNGLLVALELENAAQVQQVVSFSLANGVLTDWFLFAPQCLRIAPPLNISTADITMACDVILKALDSISPAAS